MGTNNHSSCCSKGRLALPCLTCHNSIDSQPFIRNTTSVSHASLFWMTEVKQMYFLWAACLGTHLLWLQRIWRECLKQMDVLRSDETVESYRTILSATWKEDLPPRERARGHESTDVLFVGGGGVASKLTPGISVKTNQKNLSCGSSQSVSLSLSCVRFRKALPLFHLAVSVVDKWIWHCVVPSCCPKLGFFSLIVVLPGDKSNFASFPYLALSQMLFSRKNQSVQEGKKSWKCELCKTFFVTGEKTIFKGETWMGNI